jgi:MFS family permease
MEPLQKASTTEENSSDDSARRAALTFVLVIGVVSFFADFTYEGSRSITGQFLQRLGASGAIVSTTAGLGELLGYGLRFFSGRISERSRKFWPITFLGYIIQMSAVPLLAFAGSWKAAVVLILLERIGKAIRNPPRDVLLSHAAQRIGLGWGFGVHEALDQAGALVGPLCVAVILAHRGQYTLAFAILAIPAIVTIALLSVARFFYPNPEDLETKTIGGQAEGLPRIFWIYLAGAALVSAGFADFQLIAFHFQKTAIVKMNWIPVFYSVAMGVSGIGSLVFGKLFDRFGVSILVPLTVVCSAFAPLVFLGGMWSALLGAAIWGLGMGVHESIVPAAVATMVPAERRPSAYGLFTGVYGISWFVGSLAIGLLYDRSVVACIAFCIVCELAAIPLFFRVKKSAPSFS